MRKNEFRVWLEDKINKKSAGDCLSRCQKVEKSLNVDLEQEYQKDKGKTVLSAISYRTKDAKANVPLPKEFLFKEGSNSIQRMQNLRSAVKQYFAFCSETKSK